MKILFLTDNFPPEFNAPATRTFEHCKEWVRQGAEVTVITCVPNFPKGEVFPDYTNKLKQTEWIEGIKVVRVWSFISPNQGFFRRTLDFISFAISSFIFGLPVKCDIIVATSPQFFTAVSGFMLSIFKRKRWVMEVRDIWPESLVAVGAVKPGRLINFLEGIELFLYRNAYKLVVVTESFKKSISERGIDEKKIFVVKNGADVSTFRPTEKNAKLASDLNLRGKFVVGYLGTHGMAHGLDFIVRSISTLSDSSFHFLFIGDGAVKQDIVKLSQDLNIQNITFVDAVKKTEIPAYLAVIDLSLVPLRKSTTFESVIPSKIFESAAMNIPILLGVDGETRRLVECYNSGVFYEPENEKDFIEKLKLTRKKVEHGNEFLEGCQQMAKDFDRKRLAAEMLKVLST